MTRPAPRYHAPQIVAGVILDPNGGHLLQVALPGQIVTMQYDTEQVEQLARAIERYRAVVVSADGGPDFHNRKFVPLEGA